MTTIIPIRWLLAALLFALPVSCKSNNFIGDGNTNRGDSGEPGEGVPGHDGSVRDVTGIKDGEEGTIQGSTVNVLPFDKGRAVDSQQGLGASKGPLRAGRLDLSIPPGETLTGSISEAKPPLDLLFNLDVTDSMDINFPGIRDNIGSIGTNLSANFDVRYGMVTFTDPGNSAHLQSLPLSDLSTFQSYVSKLSTHFGGDDDEAALDGLIRGMQSLNSQDPRPEAYRAVVSITDNVAYSPADGNEDSCPIGSAVSFLNGLSEAVQKKTMIFYSVASVDQIAPGHHDPCSPYNNAVEQWNDILSKIFTSVPQNQRGGLLPYPFSSSSATALVNQIKSITSSSSQQVCLVQSAKLLVPSANISYNWTTPSLPEAYQSFKSGKPIRVKQAMSDGEVAAIKSDTNAQVQVTRCCVTNANAAAGNFTCSSTQVLQQDYILAPASP